MKKNAHRVRWIAEVSAAIRAIIAAGLLKSAAVQSIHIIVDQQICVMRQCQYVILKFAVFLYQEV